MIRPGEAPGLTAELREAFASLARGDLDALETVYDMAGRTMYATALWRTGSAADAADVVQDAFVKLAQRRAELADVRDPVAYLLVVTHRLAVDRHRARRRRAECDLEDALVLPAPGAGPDEAVAAQRASRALAALPAPQREAVGLHVVCGMTYREVARALGVPTFTAASRVRLGLARMRRLLGEGEKT